MSASKKRSVKGSHELDESLGFLINVAAKSMRSALTEKLKAHKINTTQWVMLQGLADNSPMTQTDLGKKVELDNPTITKTVDKLEQAGLLKRISATEDRRTVLVTLTPKGKRLLPSLNEAATEINKLSSKGLSSAKYRTLLNELKLIRENLQNNSTP